MRDVWLSVYVLVWPAIVAVVLWLMVRGVIRDTRRARKRGEDLV